MGFRDRSGGYSIQLQTSLEYEIHFGQKPTEVKLPGVDRDEIPRPSAKSVYRLADKVREPKLSAVFHSGNF